MGSVYAELTKLCITMEVETYTEANSQRNTLWTMCNISFVFELNV